MIKTGLLISFIGFIIISLVNIWAMGLMPETGDIPIHWNINGEADRFTTPHKAKLFLWIIPAIMIGTSLLLAVLPRIDPRKINLEKSARAYLAIWISMIVMMSCVSVIISLSLIHI